VDGGALSAERYPTWAAGWGVQAKAIEGTAENHEIMEIQPIDPGQCGPGWVVPSLPATPAGCFLQPPHECGAIVFL
jgi:hypothetical protein